MVLASGSYGGVRSANLRHGVYMADVGVLVIKTYIPHIATVIHEQNTALAQSMVSRGKLATSPLLVPGAQHINLESLMISNPYSVRPFLVHYRFDYYLSSL